jgi:hypothetical protein
MTDMTDPHAIRTLIAKGAQRLNTFFYAGVVMGALRGPAVRCRECGEMIQGRELRIEK